MITLDAKCKDCICQHCVKFMNEDRCPDIDCDECKHVCVECSEFKVSKALDKFCKNSL